MILWEPIWWAAQYSKPRASGDDPAVVATSQGSQG